MCRGLCVLLVGAVIAGCATRPDVVERDGPPPGYEEVAAAYNARVEAFTTLWGPVNVHYIVRRDGNTETDKGEGHLQIVRPSRLALSVGKFGETYFYLGSNEEEYWWFDMGDAEDKWALYGRHDAATPATVERFGLPIRPLELMGVVGVLTLPETGGETSWSADGRWLVVTTPTESGATRLAVDEQTYVPVRIDLLDADGEVVVSAEHSESIAVLGAPVGTTTPKRYVVTVLAMETEIRLVLRDAQVREIKDVPFDRAKLMKAYKIDNEVDLDDGGDGP